MGSGARDATQFGPSFITHTHTHTQNFYCIPTTRVRSRAMANEMGREMAGEMDTIEDTIGAHTRRPSGLIALSLGTSSMRCQHDFGVALGW